MSSRQNEAHPNAPLTGAGWPDTPAGFIDLDAAAIILTDGGPPKIREAAQHFLTAVIKSCNTVKLWTGIGITPDWALPKRHVSWRITSTDIICVARRDIEALREDFHKWAIPLLKDYPDDYPAEQNRRIFAGHEKPKRGRKVGFQFYPEDTIWATEGVAMMEDGRADSMHDAALALADKLKGTTVDSKVKRLERAMKRIRQ